MVNLRVRRRPASDRSSEGDVRLDAWSGRGEQMMTPINRPDGLHPVDHVLPVTVPDPAHLQQLVSDKAAELHAHGALDAGTPDALDYWIDQLRVEWDAHVIQVAEDRRRTAGLLAAVQLQNLHQEGHERGQRNEQLAHLTACRTRLRSQLLGRRAVEEEGDAGSRSGPPHHLTPPVDVPRGRLRDRLRVVPPTDPSIRTDTVADLPSHARRRRAFDGGE